MFEDRETLRQLAGFVATVMSAAHGTKWTVEERQDESGVHLVQADIQADVFVRYDQKSSDRVTFKAYYPDGAASRVYPDPAVFACSANRYKPVDQIAGDVMRKVAGDKYFAELARCRESLAKDARNIEVRHEIGDKIAAAYHADRATVTPGGPGEKGTVDWAYPVDPRPTVVINHDGTRVFLRVEDLSPSQAEAMLKTLDLITKH